MVNNSTNINHHSLKHKKGATLSDVRNAGHGLGQENVNFQPSIVDCKLNSHHENIKKMYIAEACLT
jgi:hypothetical protein